MKVKLPSFRINSFMIQFLGVNGYVEETHKTTFRLKPFCHEQKNIFETVKDHVDRALMSDKRPYLLTVQTGKGKFLAYNKGKKS